MKNKLALQIFKSQLGGTQAQRCKPPFPPLNELPLLSPLPYMLCFSSEVDGYCRHPLVGILSVRMIIKMMSGKWVKFQLWVNYLVFYTIPSSSSSSLPSVLLRLFVSSSITAAALMLHFIHSFSLDIGPPLLKMKSMTVASCAGRKYASVPDERQNWQVLSKIGYVVKSFSVATAFVCRITWIFLVSSFLWVCLCLFRKPAGWRTPRRWSLRSSQSWHVLVNVLLANISLMSTHGA